MALDLLEHVFLEFFLGLFLDITWTFGGCRTVHIKMHYDGCFYNAFIYLLILNMKYSTNVFPFGLSCPAHHSVFISHHICHFYFIVLIRLVVYYVHSPMLVLTSCLYNEFFSTIIENTMHSMIDKGKGIT